MIKGMLMKLVYTSEELRNIDTGLPISLWKKVDDTYYYVMNYNDRGVGGNLEDMREIAKERNIVIDD